MNDIGMASGLAERTKVRVRTENVCEGHGSYSDIHYLTNLSKCQLEWLAEQINCGKITIPADKPKEPYSEPDAMEKIRNCKTVDELIELDVHLAMCRVASKAFHAGANLFSDSDKADIEYKHQSGLIAKRMIELMLEQKGQNQ